MSRRQLFSLFVSIVLVLGIAGIAMGQAKKGAKKAPEKAAAPAATAAKATPTGENADALDLNSATPEKLMTLRDVDLMMARKIVAGRPYKNKNELVSKKVMTQEDLNKIARSVTVKTPDKK